VSAQAVKILGGSLGQTFDQKQRILTAIRLKVVPNDSGQPIRRLRSRLRWHLGQIERYVMSLINVVNFGYQLGLEIPTESLIAIVVRIYCQQVKQRQ
jgi:hypothetical protein